MRYRRGRHHRAAEGRRHPADHPEPEPVPGRQREDHLRRRLRDGRPGALFGRGLHHRPDGQGRPDQSRLRRRSRRDARDGQGDDGHRRGVRREARADRRRSRDRQPADRRSLDEGRQGPPDLDHRRQGPDACSRSTKPRPASARRSIKDANIIVGATFDEALEGIIRVSVVATGIEQATIARNTQATSAPARTRRRSRSAGAQAPAAPAAAPESRLADLTARLRADNQRMAERAQQLEAQLPRLPPRPRRVQMSSAPRLPPSRMPVCRGPQAPAPMQPDAMATSACARSAPKPSLFSEPDTARVAMQKPTPPETFIPPAAERRPVRAPRMPRIEELPMPAQNRASPGPRRG